MASGMSKFLEKALLEHSAGKTEFVKPTELWVALCRAEVKPGETGTQIEEEVAGKAEECKNSSAHYTGYKRVAVPKANWVLSSENPVKMKNSAKITFPACTGGSAKVKYVALLDAETAGNLFYYGEVTEFEVSTTATPPEAIVEALEITLK